jgi:NTE family protein
MRYFDTRDEAVGLDHVMASGALPPAFPAVSIDGEAYWDGGIVSNTPLDLVMDDAPRRSSVIFAAQLWHKEGQVPRSVREALSRHKDIQYASRAETHTGHQQQLHALRHVISQLGDMMPARSRQAPEVRALLDHGCRTVMHFVPLHSPEFVGEDHTKDIDFSATTVKARWQAGYERAREQLERAAWSAPVDSLRGVVVHDASEIRT